MAHLLNVWPSVRARLFRNGRILLLFDYDGTLTPIAARPEDALLPEEARERLAALAAHPRCIAGIVSGRSLDDLSVLADIDGPHPRRQPRNGNQVSLPLRGRVRVGEGFHAS